MARTLPILAVLSLVGATASYAAGPKTYSFDVTTRKEQARFVRTIRNNVGNTIRLIVAFPKLTSKGKDYGNVGEGSVSAPYGYKGSESLALFNVDSKYVFWLEGIPDGMRWEDAVTFNENTQVMAGTFRISKNKKAGGGTWYKLNWLKK